MVRNKHYCTFSVNLPGISDDFYIKYIGKKEIFYLGLFGLKRFFIIIFKAKTWYYIKKKKSF